MPGREKIPEDFKVELREILDDNRSGSRVLVSRALKLFRHLTTDGGLNRSRLIFVLRYACRSLEEKHSSLTAVKSLCDDVVLILDSAPPEKKLYKRLEKLLGGWTDLYSRRVLLQIAANLLPVLRKVRTLVSHSYSSTLLNAIAALKDKLTGLKVVQSVSAPAKEGIIMAEYLADLGVQVEIIADAALPAAVEGADAIIVGADSVGFDGIVNKLGTKGLAMASGYYDVPMYCVFDTSKMLERGKFVTIEPQDPAELAKSANENISVTNMYFDRTPLNMFTALICEQGFFTPESLRGFLARISAERTTEREKKTSS